MRKLIIFCLLIGLCCFPITIHAQGPLSGTSDFDRGDTLRGSLSHYRSCFDVLFYDLDISVHIDSQTIEGYNDIRFKAMANFDTLQLDLFDNMQINAIEFNGDTLTYYREYNAVFVLFKQSIKKGSRNILRVYYSGKPIVAVNPPWDGGFTWQADEDGNPWIGVSCEGIGASLWWPNKDHLSDEPDSMRISVTVPDSLINVSNGRLEKTTSMPNGQTRYSWYVSYPINNYNVTVNIAKYAHFSDTYGEGENTLSLDYYVLPKNLEKAKKHFEQVKPMMACFDKYLGPFPFMRDGFKLVETPYLGMEHQSAIAYGNGYLTGYAGMDYSLIGLDFDYIIIHETGHEWWGNLVSAADIADLWIHEGFCTYSEALYVECMFGYEKAMQYVNAKQPTIDNEYPIIGIYGVNHEGAGDMYNKGMLMLNTFRHVLDDDELWFSLIKKILKEFGYKTTSTDELVAFINAETGRDYTYFFKQYLKYPDIPEFQYRMKRKRKKAFLEYKWLSDELNFVMPVKVTTAPDEFNFIYPTRNWQKMELPLKKKAIFRIAEDGFYIKVKEL